MAEVTGSTPVSGIVFYGKGLKMENLDTLRHSCSHVMAQAVKRLYPDVKLAIGPFITDGFYYDFDKAEPFVPEDLDKIAREMDKIIKEDLKFKQYDKKKDDAVRFLKEKGEKYKLEIIKELPGDTVSFYEQDSFVDLCSGPHVESTGEIKWFKLTSIAGSYWRGDEKRERLQRIYGTAFYNKKELDEYLHMLDEAKKRDHRKLGKELDLYSVHEEAGAGLIYWHPKGSIIRKEIEDFWKDEHLKNGYELINIPHIAKIDLWKISGHLDFYQENMYSPIDVEEQKYMLKPMNCPGHVLIYKTKIRSYRDLPIRWAELGTVYRYERSGVLHGLMRVRGFTQDDAHIFCRPEQLEEEIIKVIEFVLFILKAFGFEKYEVYLSTRPEKKYVGSLENWKKATDALKSALEKVGLKYEVDPGEGVFYGPKVDIKIKDSLNRSWQCSTVQVDFNLPERFKMEFINKEGAPETPIMIHRALMGSLERFFGVLIEHYGGNFPLWLSPVQAAILTITDAQIEYAKGINDKLTAAGLRVKADFANEKIGKKIRNAEVQKIPYMLVIGGKEQESGKIMVRKKGGKSLGQFSVDDWIKSVLEEVNNKSLK